MLCFQSLLGLGISGICIQPRIIGNVFFTFTNVFYSCYVFYVI